MKLIRITTASLPDPCFGVVIRAYREFRNEPPGAPWDQAGTFDAIYELAKAKDVPVEF